MWFPKSVQRALLLRIAGEFPEGEADAAEDDLVGANGVGSFVADGAAGGHVVVLFHAVAGDAEAADHHAVAVERRRAGEEDDARLIRVRRLMALRAGVRDI